MRSPEVHSPQSKVQSPEFRVRRSAFDVRRSKFRVSLLLCFLAFCPILAQAQPANDNFAGAQPLQGPSGTVIGNNINATRDLDEPVVPNTIGGALIWYKWTAPANGAYTFNTFGSVLAD